MKITGVAIQYNGKIYSLPEPNRHHNVIRMIADENGKGISGPSIQGFLTENGSFLNRKDAYDFAVNNGQIKMNGELGKTNLYSEDLW